MSATLTVTIVCQDTLPTVLPGVFSGGDVATSRDTVIKDMAAVKLAEFEQVKATGVSNSG